MTADMTGPDDLPTLRSLDRLLMTDSFTRLVWESYQRVGATVEQTLIGVILALVEHRKNRDDAELRRLMELPSFVIDPRRNPIVTLPRQGGEYGRID